MVEILWLKMTVIIHRWRYLIHLVHSHSASVGAGISRTQCCVGGAASIVGARHSITVVFEFNVMLLGWKPLACWQLLALDGSNLRYAWQDALRTVHGW